jgi:sirohydrochlorin ferrochelatase
MNPTEAVILIDHGSRRPEAHDALAALARRVERRLGVPVLPAHMDMAEPRFAAAAAQALADGATRLIVAPLFWFAGAHASEDVPAQIRAFEREHPEAQVVIRPVIGEAEGLADLLAAHARGDSDTGGVR